LVAKYPEVEDRLSYQDRAFIDDEIYGSAHRTLNRTAYGYPADGSAVLLFNERVSATAINCGFFTFDFEENE
jgi:hypothetical protein